MTAAQAGQFVLPGATANPTNPVHSIWRGVWTPASYAGNYSFTVFAGTTPGTAYSSILIQYGLDPNGDPLYVAAVCDSQFGSSVPVLVVPAPAAAIPLALMPLLARRRR